jgi:acetyl-CoA carboxylase carboxyl transferase subunit alpha
VANRVFILENAYYSVISPESCAAIIWRDAGQAEKAAAALRITAQDLQELGIVDDIVPEPEGGAHEDPSAAAENLGRVLRHALAQLSTMTPEQLVEDRYQKFRKMASFYTEQ